jgi:hypothetical protein
MRITTYRHQSRRALGHLSPDGEVAGSGVLAFRDAA